MRREKKRESEGKKPQRPLARGDILSVLHDGTFRLIFRYGQKGRERFTYRPRTRLKQKKDGRCNHDESIKVHATQTTTMFRYHCSVPHPSPHQDRRETCRRDWIKSTVTHHLHNASSSSWLHACLEGRTSARSRSGTRGEGERERNSYDLVCVREGATTKTWMTL
jgi:hypothetical protein